tara:strand:+ start:81 stop:1769 length:1689 start_codon:yes stop_codon:yes gene_type:complete
MNKSKTSSNRYPATLLLPGDAFDTENNQLMGRRVAGKEFATGLVRNLSHGEELNIIVYSDKERKYLKKILSPFLIKDTFLNIYTDINKLNINELENLHVPGPNIERWTAIRANSESNKFSITGIIHTLCTNSVIDGFKEYIFGGLEPWDALICTSSCGKEVVEKTINFYLESFEKKYNVKINNTKLPQLYTIPLAVNDITYDNLLTRNQKRLNSRKRLGISEEAIVILYLGRLSFHAKSHPIAIYKALSKINQNKTNEEIILLECGTFANERIENLCNNIIYSFKNLTVKRVGGIKQASEEAKIDSLNAANIFISLSDNIQETFGLTVIEAMAAELPCIVSDWNGYKDLVKDNKTGYLIPTKYAVGSDELINKVDIDYKTEKISFDYMIGLKSMKTVIDEDALINKLSLLINNKELREYMGINGKKRWNELFNWKVVSNQYRELWADLKEKREKSEKSSSLRYFHPSIDYLFKEYPTETYNKESLFVENGSINPEFLLFPLHSQLVEIITTNKTKKIIEFINKNKKITTKDLKMLGIEKNKLFEVMALIEKLGIAKNKSKSV